MTTIITHAVDSTPSIATALLCGANIAALTRTTGYVHFVKVGGRAPITCEKCLAVLGKRDYWLGTLFVYVRWAHHEALKGRPKTALRYMEDARDCAKHYRRAGGVFLW